MKATFTRRAFAGAMAAAAAVPALPAAQRKLKIGYTCITWNAFPRTPDAMGTLEAALKDISSLGFHCFETFPEILEMWDEKGTLTRLIDQYGVPLRSGYCGTNLTDPAMRKDSLDRVIRLGKRSSKSTGAHSECWRRTA